MSADISINCAGWSELISGGQEAIPYTNTECLNPTYTIISIQQKLTT